MANRTIADITKWLKDKKLKIAPEWTKTVFLVRGRKKRILTIKVENA